MKIIVPLVAVIAFVALAVVVTQPWDDEATGEVWDYAVCNVAVQRSEDPNVRRGAMPTDLLALNLQGPPLPADLPDQARLALADRLKGSRGYALVIYRGHDLDGPAIYIDALTGERVVRFGQDNGLEALANGVRLISNDEKTWPYRDIGPVRREGVSKTQGGLLRWREPDFMSGLTTTRMLGDAGPGFGQSGEGVTLQGCKSYKTIVAYADGTSEITEDNVAPEDQAAFDAFFAEVEVVKP